MDGNGRPKKRPYKDGVVGTRPPKNARLKNCKEVKKHQCEETSDAGQAVSSRCMTELKARIEGDITDTRHREDKYDTDVDMDQTEESFEQMKGLNSSIKNWEIFLAKNCFTVEEDNYLRVCLLLFNIGTPALHKKFTEAFSKVTLPGMDRNATLHEIFNHYPTILDDLQNRRLITQSNLSFLQSPDQIDNSELYDIKLMAVLLTTFESNGIITLNESESNGIIKQDDTKKSIQDLHKQRNNIAHKMTPTLSNDELNKFWKIITEAIQQLGGTSFERECYTLRNATPGSANTIIHKNIKDILGFISDFEFKHYQETKSTTSQTEGDSENSISQTEKVNFVRFCSLLIQIAPIAVRFRFREILSEILDETLKKANANSDVDCNSIDYLGTMFSLLDLRHPVVLPSRINGKDNVDNCSLPFMLLLLKQCQKFRILEELPDPSDTTNDADLTRINYYTTLIGDEKTPRSITTSNFNDIWNIVAEAISRLGDVQMKQQCVCLRKADINEMNTDIMLGLIEVQKKIITLQKYLDKFTEKLAEHKCPLQGRKEEVDEWVVEDRMFVETRSSNLLLNRSRDKDIKSITVVGSFGVGKSFTTRHVSLILRHEGYRILPVSTVTEIREFDDENIPTVFIVDDFCGRIGVEQRTRNINKWRRMPEVLLGIKSKIIVCCTSMVYQHRSFQSLSHFCSCVIDIALDRDELRSIAKKHADIDDELVMKYSMEYSFFPFLCKQCPILSRKGENVSQRLCHESIFKNANVVYESELKIFQKEDEAKYTALALLVQLNNYLKEGYFIETSEDYRSVLDKINITLEACKFNQTCALADIEEELKSMIGSYIIVSTDAKNNKVYSAKTPEVYRVLMTHFKMELPEYFSESFPSHTNYLKLNSVPNLRNLFGLLNFFGFNRHR